MLRIPAIDSHTGGEPTRVVLEGGIELRGATMAERAEDLATRMGHLASAVVGEPRGSDVLVGAVLTPPTSPDAVVGVVFFNPVGPLGMCGHGTIGVVETLRHLGRIGPGSVTIDTPVGPVSAELAEDGEVSVRNVVSRRYRHGVAVEVEGLGRVIGDVAYGGNWFFVVHSPTWDIRLSKAAELTDAAWRIRRALERDGIAGEGGATIDHIEMAGPSSEGDSRNFVLCPGGAYDRSPCGTGTSAKMACLFADGLLAAGSLYRQESVTGSVFVGSVEPAPDGVLPTIRGRAHITAELTLVLNDDDSLRWGMPG